VRFRSSDAPYLFDLIYLSIGHHIGFKVKSCLLRKETVLF